MQTKSLLNKGLAIGIILLFIGICFIPAIAQDTEKPLPASRGNWLYVGGSGPGNYTRIIDAVNNASDNDTIFVYSGTYFESFSISKSVNLVGEDKNTTIIDAQGSAHVIDFHANWITVREFTLTNTRNWAGDCGINIESPWYNNITNCNTIINNIFTEHRREAICIDHSAYNNISNNLFKNNSDSIVTIESSNCNVISSNVIFGGNGISLWNAPYYNKVFNNQIIKGSIYIDAGGFNLIDNNTIEKGGSIQLMDGTHNNVVKNNLLHLSNEIILEKTSYNIVQENEFIDSQGLFISGGTIDQWNTHTIQNNFINGKPIIYFRNTNIITMPSIIAQIILANCQNCYIQNISLNNSFCDGITLAYCTGIVIQGSSINNSHHDGIKLAYCTGIVIQGNSFYNNSYALDLEHSQENLISQNIFTKNDDVMLLEYCDNNRIENNSISENNRGLSIFNSNNCLIKNCDFSYDSKGVLMRGDGDITINNCCFKKDGRPISFLIDYTKIRTITLSHNYYSNKLPFLPKIIIGNVQTRFIIHTIDGPVAIDRPGFLFDFSPALIPM
jgi:parallel beta-helix repeat protein